MRLIKISAYINNYDGRANFIAKEIARHIHDAQSFIDLNIDFQTSFCSESESCITFTANDALIQGDYQRMVMYAVLYAMNFALELTTQLKTQPYAKCSALEVSVTYDDKVRTLDIPFNYNSL